MANRRGHLLAVLAAVVISVLASPARADLVISRVDRQIDLTSHIVRVITSLKIENTGPSAVSHVLLSLPDAQAKNLAAMKVYSSDGRGKGLGAVLLTELVQPEGAPADITYFSVSLTKSLEKGKATNIEMLAIFTNSLQPFPEEITQAEGQLVIFQDSAHFLSPYAVKVQTLNIALPSGRVESYTKYPNTKHSESQLRYGPYEDLPAFSYAPFVVHFENNNPFPVARDVIREIEISHWGNIQITEHYSLFHGGARLKGGFSRIDYQSRPYLRGASSFRNLFAKLPPNAHSVYYRDEIGNVSTSRLLIDSRKTQLEIEPRFPMFGGWNTTFTIGYGLPLQNFLFGSDEKRFLNISFGSPIEEILIQNLIVKVVLPEGSKDISVSLPFSVKEGKEVKYSHLDTVGRPVVLLEKTNVVPENSLNFQVYYKFSSISLLREPTMLIVGFFLLFAICILYMHTDMSISKYTASYLAKMQLDEIRATVQRIRALFDQVLAVHDKLDNSLRELSRNGDVQACKAARKVADLQFKELAKELRPLLSSLQASAQSSQFLPKVEELVAKEKEMEDKLMVKHATVVDSFEKKLRGADIENKIALQQQKLAALRQEVEGLLEHISEV